MRLRTTEGRQVPTPTEARMLARAASILERCTVQGRDAMTSPQAVREYLRTRLACLPHEVFACLFLDAQNRVVGYEELFRGTLTQTSVYPREVVKAALARQQVLLREITHRVKNSLAIVASMLKL